MCKQHDTGFCAQNLLMACYSTDAGEGCGGSCCICPRAVIASDTSLKTLVNNLRSTSISVTYRVNEESETIKKS